MRSGTVVRVRLCLAAGAAALALVALVGCAVGPKRAVHGADHGPPARAASTSPVAQDRTPTPVPVPVPQPVDECSHNTARQLVLVDVSAQRAWFCTGDRTVYDTAVTTGMDTPDTETPLGEFHIQGKDTDTTLVPRSGVPYPVKYWIPFDAPLYGFHDSSWQHFPYGSPLYRTEGSHGCVHLPLAAIEYLYRWADIGAAVDIRA